MKPDWADKMAREMGDEYEAGFAAIARALRVAHIKGINDAADEIQFSHAELFKDSDPKSRKDAWLSGGMIEAWSAVNELQETAKRKAKL